MKSLTTYPYRLINKAINNICEGLFNLQLSDPCHELVESIDGFKSDLRRWIRNELIASSIINESKKEEENI